MAKINKNNFNNNRSYVNVVFLLLYKFNAFFILTKHLPHTVAITLATVKLTHISFFFFTVSQIDDAFLPSILAFTYDTLPFSLSQKLSPFHLKAAFHGYSMACPNCQHRS